jgi:hypothetical protein
LSFPIFFPECKDLYRGTVDRTVSLQGFHEQLLSRILHLFLFVFMVAESMVEDYCAPSGFSQTVFILGIPSR